MASTKAFLGGSEATYSLPGTKTNNNLVGCLKKVTHIASNVIFMYKGDLPTLLETFMTHS